MPGPVLSASDWNVNSLIPGFLGSPLSLEADCHFQKPLIVVFLDRIFLRFLIQEVFSEFKFVILKKRLSKDSVLYEAPA
jgi:hypothetical protein